MMIIRYPDICQLLFLSVTDPRQIRGLDQVLESVFRHRLSGYVFEPILLHPCTVASQRYSGYALFWPKCQDLVAKFPELVLAALQTWTVNNADDAVTGDLIVNDDSNSRISLRLDALAPLLKHAALE